MLGILAIDVSFDGEQCIDAAYDLDCDRRDGDILLARSLEPRALLQVGHGEEWSARMHPACGLLDRLRLAGCCVELAVAVEGIGLEDAAVAGEMCLRVLTLSIARVVEHRCRRVRSAERPVIPHIDPASAGIGLAF